MTIMTVSKLTSRLLLPFLCVSLAGCGLFYGEDGWFRNRSTDYQKADTIPPLVLDESLDKRALGDLYPVPRLANVAFEEDVTGDVPRPQPISSNLLEQTIKIQRLGGQSWILMNVAPGEIWPRIRSFLNVNGLDVAKADISRGVIESDWVQFKTDLSTYDRYRIQIDQGVQPETSEIHIRHMSVPVGTPVSVDMPWVGTSTSAERERWLLDELAATLANDQTEGGTSLLAQAIGGNVKANLTSIGGEPVLNLRLDRARALGTLLHATRQDGFVHYENNSEAGVFYVYYQKVDPDGPGWLTRLRNSGFVTAILGTPKEERLKKSSPYTLDQLLENLPQGDALIKAPLSNRKQETRLPNAPGYLVIVTGDEGDLQVRIRDPYGKRLDSRTARDLLTLVRKNLI
jgi:outer membrane protein assembly factor BamC